MGQPHQAWAVDGVGRTRVSSMIPLVPIIAILVFLGSTASIASCFVTNVVVVVPLRYHPRASPSRLAAAVTTTTTTLTDRQLQFWEDVEDGLDDLEAFYVKRGQSLERIRDFAKRAQGELPPPTSNADGHEPSEEHVGGLTAMPFWDITTFPWATELESKSGIILKEFESKLAVGDDDPNNQNLFATDSAWQNQVMGSGWSAIRLQRLGVWNTENCQLFPNTYQLLRSLQIPLAVRGVCFARQAPQSGVQPHSDGRNFILTAHLGLKVPQGCWIQVGTDDNKREWIEGKLIVMDTSFRHSTGNPTDNDRHVLIIDFWHPELTEAERSALQFVYDLRNKFESGQVPVRKPRRSRDSQESGGLGGWWQSITGGDR